MAQSYTTRCLHSAHCAVQRGDHSLAREFVDLLWEYLDENSDEITVKQLEDLKSIDSIVNPTDLIVAHND